MVFSLKGRKIHHKLRFIVPLTCIYSVQTPLLMSQVKTGNFFMQLNSLSHSKQINT